MLRIKLSINTYMLCIILNLQNYLENDWSINTQLIFVDKDTEIDRVRKADL